MKSSMFRALIGTAALVTSLSTAHATAPAAPATAPVTITVRHEYSDSA